MIAIIMIKTNGGNFPAAAAAAAVLVRNPFDRILHIQPYFLEEQQQFVSTTNLLNWLCKKNELCIMRERSNHIQIINFNEWPISSAESAANFTPHNCSPHYRHTSPLSVFVTLHHQQHYHHNLLLGAMQCASSAMIAPLLRSCSLSLSLARCWLCAVQATPIIGCANGCLCV